jgi:Na+/H+-dicarboxylate symporter
MPAVLAAWPVPPEAAAGLRAGVANAAEPFVAQTPHAGDWLRGFLPSNPVKAAADGAMAPLVIFAVLFALAASRVSHDHQDRLTGIFDAIAQTMLVMVGWVLWLGPIGVFALGLGVGAHAGVGALGVLGHYVLIISGICLAVALLQYPLAVFAGRRRLTDFARAVAPAQIVAFSTQSSIASLPAMLEGTGALGVSARGAGVVLPLAVSLFRITSPAANLAVAIYVAHVHGIALGPAQLALGVAIAAIVSLAAVGLPGQTTFFTTITPICLAMGVPMELLPILLAVETIPDIFRTVGNVTADVAAAAVVDT